jgi:phage terminase small subunit
MGRIGKNLTQKQKIFIAEYGLDFNATRAALAAGYSPNRPDRAGEIGYQLLQKTPIKEALQRATEERLRRIGIHAYGILEGVARIAFSDIRTLFNDDGSLKLPKDWDPEIAAAVAEFWTGEEFSGRGGRRKPIGHREGVKLFDKVKALRLLGKYLNLFPDSDQKVGVEVHVREPEPATPPTLELSPRLISLLKLAMQRKKEAEQAQIQGEGCSPTAKGFGLRR